MESNNKTNATQGGCDTSDGGVIVEKKNEVKKCGESFDGNAASNGKIPKEIEKVVDSNVSNEVQEKKENVNNLSNIAEKAVVNEKGEDVNCLDKTEIVIIQRPRRTKSRKSLKKMPSINSVDIDINDGRGIYRTDR